MSFDGANIDLPKRKGPPLTEREVMILFHTAAMHVWGQEAVDKLYLQQDLGGNPWRELARIIMGRFPLPYAVGRRLIQPAAGGHYRLWMNKKLFSLPNPVVWKVLVHEAVHIGHPGHDGDFNAVALECGGATTERSLMEDYKVVVLQKNPGERKYRLIKEFEPDADPNNMAKTATEWARANAPLIRKKENQPMAKFRVRW